MKSKIVYLLYKLFYQANPSQAISKSLLVSEIPNIFRNNQSMTRILSSWIASVALPTLSYILYENIHTTRVVTLSAGELGSISKYSSRLAPETCIT